MKEFISEKYNFFNIQDNHNHAVSGWTIHTKDIAYEQNLLQQLKDKDKIIALQDEKIKALTHEITMLNSHTKK